MQCSSGVQDAAWPGFMVSGLQRSDHSGVFNRWTTSLTSIWKAWTPPSKMAVGRTREPALRLYKHPVSLQTTQNIQEGVQVVRLSCKAVQQRPVMK